MTAPLAAEFLDHIVTRARLYLQAADLTTRNCEEFAQELGVHPNTVHFRLRAAGTRWPDLHHQERLHRLNQLLAHPGKFHPEQAAELCGFQEVASFFVFFQAVRGETYTAWRLRRQLQ